MTCAPCTVPDCMTRRSSSRPIVWPVLSSVGSLLSGNDGLSWRHAEPVIDLQNEPDLDLTMDESQQRVARVMQSAAACSGGAFQVQHADASDARLPRCCTPVTTPLTWYILTFSESESIATRSTGLRRRAQHRRRKRVQRCLTMVQPSMVPSATASSALALPVLRMTARCQRTRAASGTWRMRLAKLCQLVGPLSRDRTGSHRFGRRRAAPCTVRLQPIHSTATGWSRADRCMRSGT